MIKIPRLKTNRHGVYCLRVYWRDEDGKLRENLHSLGTKTPALARVLALQFNEAFERKRTMTDKAKPTSLLDKIADTYKLDIAKGVMEANGPEDHALMLQAIEAYHKTYGQMPPILEAMQNGATPNSCQFTPPASPAKPLVKSMRLTEAIPLYVKEKQADNAKRTLYEKNLLFADFQGLLGDLELNLYDKPTLVQ